MLYLTIGKLAFYNKSLPYKVILPAFPVLMSMKRQVRKSGSLHLKKPGDYQIDVPKKEV
jgi:hypothetical protein